MQHEETAAEFKIVVSEGVESQRLDSFLSGQTELGLTRSRIQKLIAEGRVLVNGAKVPKKHVVSSGEEISVSVPPPEVLDVKGEDIALDVLFEDDHLVVVNKPPGIVTHPAPGNYSGTLVNALIHRYGKLASIGGNDRPGIVHRLDKLTSGLLIVARSDDAYQQLQKMIQEREVKRTYLALICGHMPEDSGTIELPIGRSVRDRRRMSVTHVRSRHAETDFVVSDRFRSYDLLDVNLQTGRTHQIRVHFAHLGHPVFGDPDYGGRNKWHRGVFAPERVFARKLLGLMQRQALHATRLEFTHPMTGEELNITCQPPDDFQQLLETLHEEGR